MGTTAYAATKQIETSAFLADRTDGRAYASVASVCRL